MVDDADAVGQRVGLLEVLRREEHGHALVVREPPDLLPERRSALQVEARRRLVEEQDARAVHEREREVQAALHAARVAADAAIGRFGQPDALEQLLRAPRALGLGHALQRRLQHEVLAPGEDRVERGLLQRGADRGAHLRALADDVVAADARASAGRRQQRRQHQHGRRLAGAVGPEEAVDLAGRDRQVDAVDRARALAELAHEPLAPRSRGLSRSSSGSLAQTLSLSTIDVPHVLSCLSMSDGRVRSDARALAAEEAWALLHQLMMGERRRFLAIAAELDLHPAQAGALAQMEPDTPVPMNELATLLHCDNSNVTGIVDRLEARGLVERRPYEHDRRVKQIVLTPLGVRAACARARAHGRGARGVQASPAADQRVLRDILRRALEHG